MGAADFCAGILAAPVICMCMGMGLAFVSVNILFSNKGNKKVILLKSSCINEK